MKKLTASAGTKSMLGKPVQELIKMIFDVESMKKAMVEFEVKQQGPLTLSPHSHSAITAFHVNLIISILLPAT